MGHYILINGVRVPVVSYWPKDFIGGIGVFRIKYKEHNSELLHSEEFETQEKRQERLDFLDKLFEVKK